MKYLIPVVTLFFLLATSCKKDKDMSSATVIDTGDITKGGCGYTLLFDDGVEQKPEYLPSSFQHHNLRVKVKSHYGSGQEVCSPIDTQLKYLQVIIIDDIKREL